MTVVRAIVQEGRIRVDEPTDLPDGTELVLVDEQPELTPEQIEGIRLSVQELDRGMKPIPLADVMDELDEELDALIEVHEQRERRRRTG